MKISPIPSTGATVGAIVADQSQPQTTAQRLRSLKMKTNANPTRIEETDPAPVAAETKPVEEVSISDANNTENTDQANEATKPLSPQLAAIAKQRRALQQEQQAFEKRVAEFEASKQTGSSFSIDDLKSNPIGVLLKNGISWEQLTESAMQNQDDPSTSKFNELSSKLDSLEQRFDKKLTDRELQAEQAALGEMEKEANSLAAQGDDFEAIRETKSVPKVMELIKRTYKEQGEVLDVREAMMLIEGELIQESLKRASLKKVQSQLTPAQPAPTQPVQQQRQMRTLTNRDTASVQVDRRARAIMAFQGNLKK